MQHIYHKFPLAFVAFLMSLDARSNQHGRWQEVRAHQTCDVCDINRYYHPRKTKNRLQVREGQASRKLSVQLFLCGGICKKRRRDAKVSPTSSQLVAARMPIISAFMLRPRLQVLLLLGAKSFEQIESFFRDAFENQVFDGISLIDCR